MRGASLVGRLRPVLAVVGWLCLAVSSPAKLSPGSFDLGFLASRHDDVLGHTRTRALGPILERVETPGSLSYHGVRPITSGVTDRDGKRSVRDVIWPLGSYRTLADETSWRAGIFFGFGHDGRSSDRRHREWFIPFYFQGRNADGETYHALFPLGGRIDEILGRDTVSFTLFPLYLSTRINDVTSTAWLWPVVSHTRGPGIERWRVFPFYGEAHHEGKYNKRFVLWPIWNDVTYHYPNSHGSGFVLFPLYGQLRLSDQSTTWVLPPLFRFTRGEMQDLVYAPWPFVQWGRGEKDFFRLWPLYGWKSVGNVERTSVLWPIFWHETVTHPEAVQKRFLAVPFVIHTHRYREDTDGARETVGRYMKVWPLFSYRLEDGVSRFRLIELLPFGEMPGLERNWSPLWTLFERTSRGEDVDTELLWGLYRDLKRGDEARYRSLFPLVEHWRDERVEPPYSGWSILKGLVGRERRGEDTAWRLLYLFRLGDNVTRPEAGR